VNRAAELTGVFSFFVLFAILWEGDGRGGCVCGVSADGRGGRGGRLGGVLILIDDPLIELCTRPRRSTRVRQQDQRVGKLERRKKEKRRFVLLSRIDEKTSQGKENKTEGVAPTFVWVFPTAAPPSARRHDACTHACTHF
jgi:hypothetical protein